MASNNKGPMGSSPRPNHAQKTMISIEIISQIMLAALSTSFSVQRFSSKNNAVNLLALSRLMSQKLEGDIK